MSAAVFQLDTKVRELVEEEIRRIVADAIRGAEILHTGPLASKLAKAYSNSGLSAEAISDEIAKAGARAGVALEISRP